MKLIISQDGVKRQLADKPFAICGDREALEALVAACKCRLADGHVYGWVDVYPPVVVVPNTEPSPWKSEP